MTATSIPRRLFDEEPDDFTPSLQLTKEADLRAHGLIRASNIIPIEYNERLKSMARKQGKNADQLMGELLMEMRPRLDQWEASQEAERLRERFGDQWLEILQSVNP